MQKQDNELQKLICLGKIAQQTQRYDDQIKYMSEFLKSSKQIKLQQVSLYQHGSKCKINLTRTSWRAICTLQSKQTNSKSRSSAIIQFFKQKLQKQIREICQQVITLINIISTIKCQEKVKFLCFKLKGDYHRYLCQITKDDELKKFQKEAEGNYLKGLKAIRESESKELMRTDALKLGISLNLSVFYYQIMNSTQKAIQVSQTSFNECLEAVSDIQDTRFTDLVTIMQLVHDNLVNWKSQL